MKLRARLPIRTRLTLLYTGLFALCGAVVVAVSYVLVAQLGPTASSEATSSATVPAGILAQCRARQVASGPGKRALARCVSALQLQGAQHQRDLTLSHLLEYSLITLVVVIGIAATLGWFFSGRALQPVHRITAAARAASEHNLSSRVGLRGPHDELHELAETFDEMLGRLQSAFEAQRQFIANASHELRTPLTVMRTTVDVVLDNPASTPVELRDMAVDVRGAVDRAEDLIASLLILARSERGLAVHEYVDLATIAEDVLDVTDPGDRLVHVALEPAAIRGDPVLVERLIANLVDNAVRYNIETGEIWVATSTADGVSRVAVSNTGQPVSSADADRILQPFQRLDGRSSNEGFGLGLSIVASIAGVHGGAVSARPRAGGGLSVDVVIPAADHRGDDNRAAPPRAMPGG